MAKVTGSIVGPMLFWASVRLPRQLPARARRRQTRPVGRHDDHRLDPGRADRVHVRRPVARAADDVPPAGHLRQPQGDGVRWTLNRRRSPDCRETARVARGGARRGSAGPGVPKPDPILIADGRAPALRRHHRRRRRPALEVQRGSITALIGPNGAGKTTFFNLMTGFDKPDAGDWTVRRRARWMACRRIGWRTLGMVRTFQLTKSLTKMPVIENMKLGRDRPARRADGGRACSRARWRGTGARDRGPRRRAARRASGSTTCATSTPASLSGGQRKLLEMARALMTNPTLVMLDEPMAGVNPALKQSLNAAHPRASRRRA